MPSFTVRKAGEPPRRIELDKARLVIGRSARNDVHLEDLFASRVHAELRHDDDEIWLTDLESANGTLVNNRRISGTVQVYPGDRVQIGGTVLELDPPPVPAAGAAPPHPLRRSTDPRIATTSAFLSVLRGATGGADPRAAERRSDLFSVVRNVGLALHSSGSLDEVLRQILDFTFEGVPADRAYLLLRDPDGELRPRAASYRARTGGAPPPEVQVSDTIVAEVVGKRRPIITSDAQEDERFRGRESIIVGGIRSVMAAPIELQDEVLGMLYVDSPVHINVFGEDDLALLTVIGNVAAIKIDNMRLLEQRLENERMRMQLASAREIQSRLLPALPPAVPGYDLAGVSFPCFEVGGDYFDFVRRGDRRCVVAIGDVTGKGMDAALMMSSLHAAVRAQVETGAGVGELMTRVNRYLAVTAPYNRFVTLFCAELDAAAHRLTFTNAGHNAPFLVRANGEVESLEAMGPPVAVSPDASFAERTIELAPGDVLLAYSDGVTEAASEDGRELAEEGLARLLTEHRWLGAAALRDRIDAAVGELLGSAQARDDMTLVIVKRLDV